MQLYISIKMTKSLAKLRKERKNKYNKMKKTKPGNKFDKLAAEVEELDKEIEAASKLRF